MTGNKRLRTQSASERSKPKLQLVLTTKGLRRVSLSEFIQQQDDFYAGAKFDKLPKVLSIPVPPMQWTIADETPRSHSMPSSPITVYGKSPNPPRGIKLDLDSLFGTKTSTKFCDSEMLEYVEKRLLKSRSIHEEEMVITLDQQRNYIDGGVTMDNSNVKLFVPVKKTVKEVHRPAPVARQTPSQRLLEIVKSPVVVSSQPGMHFEEKIPKKKVSGISGKDLMELLKSGSPRQAKDFQLMRTTPVNEVVSLRSCQFHHHDSADSQYKLITNHLKSILQVSITA